MSKKSKKADEMVASSEPAATAAAPAKETVEKKVKKKGVLLRGFAVMSPERVKEIAAIGGKAAHAKGTAHEFTPEEARRAGKIGGMAARARRVALDAADASKQGKLWSGDASMAGGLSK